MSTRIVLILLFSISAVHRTVGADFSGTNSTFIGIPVEGRANPYPSSITVTGMVGVAGKITVTLYDFAHTAVTDVNVLLVNPEQSGGVVLMGAAGCTGVWATQTLTFDDGAAVYLTCSVMIQNLTSGVYRATAYLPDVPGPFSPFPPETPLDRYFTNLSAFAGTNPNGTWSLYVWDDESEDSGRIAGGWSLAIEATFLLAVERSGASARISWPVQAEGFVLESAPNFSPDSWQAVPDVPVIIQGRKTVIVPAADAARFYHLRKTR